ncbi:GDP-mannose 4,6-dehydratase [Candidatus Cerribacteria bacterium 'Amazon FNV 2010 28 9']|uniref:GDP-mannose 4,6-dehydratase n=1 Tax=Candidatus Cerribacteria bacterium 'Amazon FNV 2010 28 9' TaxID=2081795 RepID=A0A317JRB5_9BACT|nr:MAG: GDP-mannose 4,6-dehydratase [Candidatus Cerribacteria bacterium 'Amazon FNV 2010 28 9']
MDQPKILITGGTGFAGSHLIENLLAQGYKDIYSTTFGSSNPSPQLLSSNHYLRVNLVDGAATAQLFEHLKPNWVFHLASFAYVGKSFEKAAELFTNNIGLQMSVLEAVRIHTPTARVLTVGSAEEYGIVPSNVEKIDESCLLNPVNPYAVSKVTQDMLAGSYALSYKLNIIRARPFNHIGTRQTGDFAVPSFARQIVDIEQGKQQKLLVGNLSGVRDFTDVDDMAKAYILLMEKGNPGEIYNIGSGINYVMSDVVKMLSSFATVPIPLEEDQTRLRPLDVPRLIADNKKIVSLGWQPTSDIKPALKNILEEWRKHSI